MTTNNGIYFNGKWIVHPGAYGTIDSSEMSSMSTGSQKIVALIGTSKGGVPGEIMWFTDPSAAKKVLKGGYLLKAAQKAWSPNSKGQGAYTLALIRANQAVQSILDLGDGIPVLANIGPAVKADTNISTGVVTSSGTYTGSNDKTIEIIIDSATSSDLTKVTYGWRYKGGNWQAENIAIPSDGTTAATIVDGVKVTFAAGNYVQNGVWSISAVSPKDSTIGGTITSSDYGAWTKKIQCKLENGTNTGTKLFTTYYYEDGTYEVIDDIGATFYLRYTGTQAYAVVNITHDALGKAIRLTTKIGPDSTTAVEDLNIDLTDARFSDIRALVDYISQYENYACRSFAVVSSGIAPSNLDAVSSASIKSDYLFTALWKDMELRINNNSSYLKFTSKSLLAGSPMNFDYTNLAGGSDGTTPSSWLQYLDLLSTYNINYVVPLTGDDAIIAESIENIKYLSANMGKERSLKVGGESGESTATTKTRALTYNSDRVQVCYPGFYDTNEYGEQELYPPFITAAMIAGRQAYLATGESATFNYFSIVGLEKDLNPTEVDSLIQSGTATMEHVIGKGYRLAQDITTYTTDTVSLYCERSVRDLADGLNKELRDKIEDEIISKKGVVTNVESVKNLVISFLQQKIRDSVIVAYKNVVVTYQNRVIYVEYGAAPVEPINFALITGHFYTPDEITG